MELQIIPKQDAAPVDGPQAIRIQYITYYPSGKSYEGGEITEEVISKVLAKIPQGTEVYLSLVPYGEDDFLEVISDGEWLALGYSPRGGQSPIEKYLALNDMEAGTDAVAYFIRTGGLYPGIDWAKQTG